MSNESDPSESREEKSSKLSLTAGLLVIVAAAFFIGGVIVIVSERTASAWPSVEGLVISSELASEDIERKNAATGRETRVTRWRVDVRYGYEVGGRRLEGTSIRLLDVATPDRVQAERQFALYPAGAKVRVYHEPDDPANAVLEPTSGVTNWAPLGFAVVLLIVAAGMRFSARFQS